APIAVTVVRFPFYYCRRPISGFQSLSSYFRLLAILAVLFLTSNSRRPSIPGFLFPTIAVVLFPASNSCHPISSFQFPSSFYSRLPIPNYCRRPISSFQFPPSYFRLPNFNFYEMAMPPQHGHAHFTNSSASSRHKRCTGVGKMWETRMQENDEKMHWSW